MAAAIRLRLPLPTPLTDLRAWIQKRSDVGTVFLEALKVGHQGAGYFLFQTRQFIVSVCLDSGEAEKDATIWSAYKTPPNLPRFGSGVSDTKNRFWASLSDTPENGRRFCLPAAKGTRRHRILRFRMCSVSYRSNKLTRLGQRATQMQQPVGESILAPLFRFPELSQPI